MPQRGVRLFVKRAVDVGTAASVLVVAAPVMAATAGLVWASMGRPVVFVQPRVGKDERVFRILKFRSMRSPRYEGEADAVRLTRVGRFLRRTSLDELPQLFNVLRGDMSLVGPRPLLVRYLPRYSARQRKRHAVLPGLTGWAQVHGRNAQTWADRFELDGWYAENWSLRLDALVLAKTVGAVLNPSGISSEGHATMPEFMGSESV